MNKKPDFNKLKDFFAKEASQLEWDDLAYVIIILEEAIKQEKKEIERNDNRDPNVLKLLELKLKIHEFEKECRVFKSFDMEYFLSKDFEYFEEEDYEELDV